MHHFHPLYHKSQVTNHGRQARLAYLPFFLPKADERTPLRAREGKGGEGIDRRRRRRAPRER